MTKVRNIRVVKSSVNEANSLLKPKDASEVQAAFASKYPQYDAIFKGLFPKNMYDVNNDGSSYFSFEHSGVSFLVTQHTHTTKPSISYLEKRDKGTYGFSGIFTGNQTVNTVDDVKAYVKRVVNKLKK